MEEPGDLPKWQANTLDVVFGQHSPEAATSHLDIWKKNNWGGLVIRLPDSNLLVEGMLYLLKSIPIFLENGLEEFQLNMEAFLVTQSPGSVHQVCKNSLYVGKMVMWSRVQVDICVLVFSRPCGPGIHPVSHMCWCQEKQGGHPSPPWGKVYSCEGHSDGQETSPASLLHVTRWQKCQQQTGTSTAVYG